MLPLLDRMRGLGRVYSTPCGVLVQLIFEGWCYSVRRQDGSPVGHISHLWVVLGAKGKQDRYTGKKN